MRQLGPPNVSLMGFIEQAVRKHGGTASICHSTSILNPSNQKFNEIIKDQAK